jgi:hypothetical protein
MVAFAIQKMIRLVWREGEREVGYFFSTVGPVFDL